MGERVRGDAPHDAFANRRDRRSVLRPHRGWLPELRRNENDLTLDAIAERLLGTHGLEADKSMLSRASSPVDPRQPLDLSLARLALK
ncbi:hypothetical protein ACF1BQ_029150 [Bradyrhizobium sp. RDT10]